MNRLTSDGVMHTAPFNAAALYTAALCIVLAACACLPAHAQDLDEASVEGRITDERGAVVVGASVSVVLSATKAERTIKTDTEGCYRFVELEPGTYNVLVSCAGFAVEERRGLKMPAGRKAHLDVVLRPANIAGGEVLVLEAEASPVDTTRTVVGGTLTREELESLPSHTRAPLDFVFTLGGVSEEPLSTRDVAEDRDARSASSAERAATTPEEAGTFALSGGAAYSNNITIDGLDDNDDRAARERFQPSLEAIEEVQVITNQFSAEYGRASGGRVNIRTRGGSHELRGRLFHFFRDEALDANSYNNKRRGLARLPLQQHNPGFTLGGPLFLPKRISGTSGPRSAPKTFFFIAYEYDTTLDSALIDALVPVEQSALFPLPQPTTLEGRRIEASTSTSNRPAELAPFIERVGTPSRSHTLTARFDHSFDDAHNASLLLQFGRLENLRQFGGGLRLAEALQGRTRAGEAVSYSDNFVFSPAIVNQLRVQLSRLRPALESRSDTRGPVVLITVNDPLDNGDGSDRSGTLVAGSSTSGATERRETRFQIQDSLTVVRGAHTFRFGGDAQRIHSTYLELADATGTYNFTSAGDFLAAAPSRFRQRFGAESTQENFYFGLFVQDDWRLRPNLTASLGLRYERETILRDRNNFAPRFALAYDPFRSGKTVLRFGAGLFFNRVLLRTVDDFTLGEQLIEFDTDNLPASERRSFIAAHLRFPQTLAPDSPLVREFGTPLVNFSRRLDPALRIPESYQFNLGFERDLGRSFVVEANYTFNRGVHLWREFNANAPVLPRGYADFAAYLSSRDFANFRNSLGARPLYNAGAAGELVRFTIAPADASAVGRTIEFGVPVSVFNLSSLNSTTVLETALAALQFLRPDPTRGQIEQLASIGNSFYHGLTLETRRRFARRAGGFGFSFRAAYTLSRLIDDGVVNTSSALRVGDFRAERARSLLDRRHRFVFSGTLDAPRQLGGLRFAGILRLASGAPFNISIGGNDRNLDDVGNDRPDFNGDLNLIRSREPGVPLDARLAAAFSLPVIGRTGNLPRNAGSGPALFTFDLNVTREFRLGERARLRPVIEIDNVLNRTVFTFAAEFINFNALAAGATQQQRQAFLDTFLVPTRTLRPRRIRLGIRFDF